MPAEAPLAGWVDISITLSLSLAPGLRKSRREKIAHAHQVLVGEGQECGELDLPAASDLRASQKSNVLCPAEGLLDTLARFDAQGVSHITGRARIDGRAATSLDVLRDMRGDVQLTGSPDELARVIALIRCEGASRWTGQLTEHVDRRAALGSATGLGHLRGDNQAIAVLADRVTEIGQLRGRPGIFFVQLCLRVSRGRMRIIRALLTAKIASIIAATASTRATRAVLGSKALVRRLCCDHRAVDAEMLIAQKARHPSLLNDGLEQLTGDVCLEQPIAVLAEGRVIPHRLIHRQPDEPAEQKVVLELLDQPPLAADRIQNLQKQCPNEPLRRNGRSSRLGVELLEPPIHLRQRLGDHRADRPQRMLYRNSRFRRNVAEHRFLLRVHSTHRRTSIVRQITSTLPESPVFFNSL